MSAPFMLIGMSCLCLAFEDSLKAGPSLLIPAPGTDVGHHAPSMVNQPTVAPLVCLPDQYGSTSRLWPLSYICWIGSMLHSTGYPHWFL